MTQTATQMKSPPATSPSPKTKVTPKRLKRFDFTASELLAVRRRNPRLRRIPKLPKPRSIKPLQKRYYEKLRPIILAMRSAIESVVLPELESILQLAKFVRPQKVDASQARADAYSDEIERIIQLAKTQFLRQFPDSFYTDVATSIARATDDLSYDNLNKIFQKVFGANYSRFEPWITQEVKGFVKANVDLITSIESTYFTKVEGIVLRGAQRGRLSTDIAKEIRDEFGVTDRRAAFIARDQVAKFNGNLTELRQKQAGINRYRWQTSEDERVRDSHRELNGKIFEWDDPPEVGNPGEDFNCRCVALPIFDQNATEEE